MKHRRSPERCTIWYTVTVSVSCRSAGPLPALNSRKKNLVLAAHVYRPREV